MTLNCVYSSFGSLFHHEGTCCNSFENSAASYNYRFHLVQRLRGPQESISASLGIRGDHFKSVQTFRHGRLSSAEVTAASSLSQWHRAGVGGGQRAGESWHFIKVAHLTDPILASTDPSFLPHLRRPLALVLLSLFLGLSACTAYETRPSVSNQVAFSQYKGGISHSLQHQSVNHCGKETVGLCIHRTFSGEDGTSKKLPKFTLTSQTLNREHCCGVQLETTRKQ